MWILTLRHLELTFLELPFSENKVIAMFYNNKGADAIVANSYTRAYSYFRAAATIAPELAQSWVNLGVLYRMDLMPTTKLRQCISTHCL